MMEIEEQPESSRRREPLKVQIVILIPQQIAMIWLEGKRTQAKRACTGWSGGPRKSTFSSLREEGRFVMWGSSGRRLKFRGTLSPSQELAEC
jgi:hypothetical protein